MNILKNSILQIKTNLMHFYEEHEVRVDIAFFLAGFVIDIFTLTDVGDWLGVFQQIVYLGIITFILTLEIIQRSGKRSGKEIISTKWQGYWQYSNLLLHFTLGSLLSLYSLLYFKSASFLSSFVFIILVMSLMVINELKIFQKGELFAKFGILTFCIFSFFIMIISYVIGLIGWIPFILSLLLTILVVFSLFKITFKYVNEIKPVLTQIIYPSSAVLILMLVLNFLALIPPVPLALNNIGIYHRIEKNDDKYYVFYEKPWWRFWHSSDQKFVSQPNDKIYVFAQIYSPAKFEESIILHWSFYESNRGWTSTDKIPMKVSGGRKEGYRGFSTKQNYQAGDWKISVETSDGREIGRIYFKVEKTEIVDEHRVFQSRFY